MTKVTNGDQICSICNQPMLIKEELRKDLGLPKDSHLDCLMHTLGDIRK